MNLPDPHYDWDFRIEGKSNGFPLLWLHGFMGVKTDWLDLVQNQFLDFRNILINLPGHGGSIIPEHTQFKNMLLSLTKKLEIAGIDKFIPIGYSMGGRIAFHLQTLAQERIPALVFLSSAPGLKTSLERQKRRIEDEQLMARLEGIGFSSFLEEWYSAELFGNIKNDTDIFSKLCRSRSNNDMGQLRKSLEIMGSGALSSIWKNLNEIMVPTLLLSGAMDSKYGQLNQEISMQIPRSSHHQIPDAGHAFHLEKPLETARLIRHFLREVIEGE